MDYVDFLPVSKQDMEDAPCAMIVGLAEQVTATGSGPPPEVMFTVAM